METTPLPRPIQIALYNIRQALDSHSLDGDQVRILATELNGLVTRCVCRVGSSAPEKDELLPSTPKGELLPLTPNDPKRLEALARKAAIVFSDIRPHDCPYYT